MLGVAGEALRGVGGLADGGVVCALDDVAVTGEVLLVEGDDLVLRVGGLESGGLDAQVEAAKAHVDVGGVGVLLVVLDGDGAGIGGDADGRGVRVVVGLDLHGAEGGSDVHVVVVAVLVVGDVAAGQQKAGERGESEGCCGGANRAVHGCLRPDRAVRDRTTDTDRIRPEGGNGSFGFRAAREG